MLHLEACRYTALPSNQDVLFPLQATGCLKQQAVLQTKYYRCQLNPKDYS